MVHCPLLTGSQYLVLDTWLSSSGRYIKQPRELRAPRHQDISVRNLAPDLYVHVSGTTPARRPRVLRCPSIWFVVELYIDRDKYNGHGAWAYGWIEDTYLF